MLLAFLELNVIKSRLGPPLTLTPIYHHVDIKREAASTEHSPVHVNAEQPVMQPKELAQADFNTMATNPAAQPMAQQPIMMQPVMVLTYPPRFDPNATLVLYLRVASILRSSILLIATWFRIIFLFISFSIYTECVPSQSLFHHSLSGAGHLRLRTDCTHKKTPLEDWRHELRRSSRHSILGRHRLDVCQPRPYNFFSLVWLLLVGRLDYLRILLQLQAGLGQWAQLARRYQLTR